MKPIRVRSREAFARASRVTTYALHPGMVASDIWRRVPWPVRPLIQRRMLTVEQGAERADVLFQLGRAVHLQTDVDSTLALLGAKERGDGTDI